PSEDNIFEPSPGGALSSSSSREGGDEDDGEDDNLKTPSATDLTKTLDDEERNAARVSSLQKLQGNISPRQPGSRSPKKKGKRRSRIPEGVIILKEERATIFHDFLKFIYPHLECTITWRNVEGLMNLSDKLCVPSLQRACLQFLLSHAAGKPIKAMRIAEIFGHEELYRESSRFVLEDPHGWSDEEMNTLSKDTLLKLEKRRNWFLERVLKLGTVSIAKEYQCCPTCPDPAGCARQLEDKWRAGYQALFRFGKRDTLRPRAAVDGVQIPTLTRGSVPTAGVDPPELPDARQNMVFDRMFSLGVRGSGVDAPPLTVRAAGAAAPPGLKRHFLYCSLKPEPTSTKGTNRSVARDKLSRGGSIV
ncbi:hypothetical protein FRC17_003880, partial [Serendipita sp. 399]